MKLIYNPRKYNGAPCVDIIDYPFAGGTYTIKKNSVMRCEDDNLAKALLENFGFLEQIKVEQLPEIQKEMEDKDFKCEYCNKEFETEQKLHGHILGAHKLSAENEAALKDIPTIGSKNSVAPTQPKESIDASEGIPNKGKDRDGVEWYGEGVQEDSVSPAQDKMMRHIKPGKTPGAFGAA